MTVLTTTPAEGTQETTAAPDATTTPGANRSGDVTQALRQVRQENKQLKAELARLRGAQGGQPQKLDPATLPKGDEFAADPESAGKKVTDVLSLMAQRLEALESERARLEQELQSGWMDNTLKKYPIFQDTVVGDDACAALVTKLQALPAGTPPEEAEKVMRETADRFSRLRAGTQERTETLDDQQPPLPPSGGVAATAALRTSGERPKSMKEAMALAKKLGSQFFASRGNR
jgi:hypothetical protein